jgi:hypothetical protein
VTQQRYSAGQLKTLWIRAGGNRAFAPIAVAVALAESGGAVNAINHNTDGSTDRGLWQINSVHGNLSTFDPLANAKAAVKISSGGLNWQPWTTYRNGAYKSHLSGARKAPATPVRGTDTTSTASSNDGQLFGESKQSQLKYAAVWAGVLGVGVAIAGIGVNRILGGAPARTAKAAAKSKAGKTALEAAAA